MRIWVARRIQTKTRARSPSDLHRLHNPPRALIADASPYITRTRALPYTLLTLNSTNRRRLCEKIINRLTNCEIDIYSQRRAERRQHATPPSTVVSLRSVVAIANAGALKEGAPWRLGPRQYLALGRRHRPCGRRLPHTWRAERLPAARRRGTGWRRRRRRGAAGSARGRLGLGSVNVPASEALHDGDRGDLGARPSVFAGVRFATARSPSCSRAQLA